MTSSNEQANASNSPTQKQPVSSEPSPDQDEQQNGFKNEGSSADLTASTTPSEIPEQLGDGKMISDLPMDGCTNPARTDKKEANKDNNALQAKDESNKESQPPIPNKPETTFLEGSEVCEDSPPTKREDSEHDDAQVPDIIQDAKVSDLQETTPADSDTRAESDAENSLEETLVVRAQPDTNPKPSTGVENDITSVGEPSVSVVAVDNVSEITRAIEPAPIEMAAEKFEESLICVLETENQSRAKDQSETRQFLGDYQKWLVLHSCLIAGLKHLVPLFESLRDDSCAAKDSLPEHIKIALDSRQAGLSITVKVLKRCTEKYSENIGPLAEYSFEVPFPEISEGDWQSLITDPEDNNPQSARTSKIVRRMERDRYQIVIAARKAEEKTRRTFTAFVEKKILPILDGIYDGKKNTEEMVHHLVKEHSENKETLENWFKTYDTMKDHLLALLANVDISPMKINIGSLVDYEKHEVVDAESNPELPDESIISEFRKGFVLSSANLEETLVLRAAQVVANKN